MSRYKVDIQGLKEKEQSHQIEIGSHFFSLFQPSYLDKGLLTADVNLKRGSNIIMLHLEIRGEVELTCDRSLRNFNYPIHSSKDILFKLGDHYEELSEDVIMIDARADSIDVSQLIYDYIALEVPMKKLHPDFAEINGEGDELIWTSNQSTSPEHSEEFEDIDPRWAKLKALNSN